MVKHNVQLGGYHNRFLPKECYYLESGTAETASYIVRSNAGWANPEVEASSRNESNYAPSLVVRAMGYFRRRLASR